MYGKHLTLAAAAAFALSTLGCQNDATEPANGASPSLSAESSTDVIERVIDITKFVPCANGGLGEDVALSGSFHDKFHVTLDGSGGAHLQIMHTPQGVTGTGLITGVKYQGVGAFVQDESNVTVGEEHTFAQNGLLIGQGPGNNLTLHADFHVTVLASGVVTSFHDNLRVTCK